MGKIVAWFLKLTKVDKVVEPVQSFLSGKKSYLTGLALAIPALITMLQSFSEGGMTYLLTMTHTPEFMVLMNGLAIMGLRAAITKAADPAKDPNVK